MYFYWVTVPFFMGIYITKNALEGVTVKEKNNKIRQEILSLLDAEVSVLINGCRVELGNRDLMIRDDSNYMKEFKCNENGELVEVDYYSYKLK